MQIWNPLIQYDQLKVIGLHSRLLSLHQSQQAPTGLGSNISISIQTCFLKENKNVFLKKSLLDMNHSSRYIKSVYIIMKNSII